MGSMSVLGVAVGMDDATIWWLLAGAAVALELFVGSFFLLMLAVGLAAGALAAHAGLGLTGQLVAAALVGGGAVALWQRWRASHPVALPATRNPDINLDIGEHVMVAHWEADGTARVRYRGADWRVQLADDALSTSPAAGLHRIVSVQGNRLLVQPCPTPATPPTA